jgi:hypothetical protein
MPLLPLKAWIVVPAGSGSSSFQKISPWDDNIGLFGLKIGWDIARAFLTEAVLMILLPDFLDSGGDSNLILVVLLVF